MVVGAKPPLEQLNLTASELVRERGDCNVIRVDAENASDAGL
jgi:hypothetical protein